MLTFIQKLSQSNDYKLIALYSLLFLQTQEYINLICLTDEIFPFDRQVSILTVLKQKCNLVGVLLFRLALISYVIKREPKCFFAYHTARL